MVNNKKILLSIVVGSIFLTGCTNQPELKEKVIEKEQVFSLCEQDGVKAPKWTCFPQYKGSVASLGIAQMNAGNDKSFQRAEAIADGRNQLVSQIEIKVSSLFKTYKGVTGAGESATFDKASSEVSKQVASQTLKGSKPVAMWNNPNTKELYILMALNSDFIKDSIEKGIKTSFNNNQALHQQFLAEKANGELDKELEKLDIERNTN